MFISIDLNWKHPNFCVKTKQKPHTPQFHNNITLLSFFFSPCGSNDLQHLLCNGTLCLCPPEPSNKRVHSLFTHITRSCDGTYPFFCTLIYRLFFFFFFLTLNGVRDCCDVVLCPLLLCLLTLFMYWTHSFVTCRILRCVYYSLWCKCNTGFKHA